MVIALPELLALAGLFLALGMVVGGQAFTEALFQVTAKGVGWIPWLGRKAENGVRVTGQRVDAVFSAMVVRLEGAISQTWHVFANLIEQTGEAIWNATELGARALYVWEVQLPLRLARFAGQAADAAGHRARTALRPIVKNYYTSTGISRAQFARFGKRLATLEARTAAIPLVGAGAIALPFPRIGALERAAHGTRERLGKLEARFGRKAFAAAVAGALVTLGISWIRKPCARRTSESFCRADSALLDAITFGMGVALTTLSFREFVMAAQSIEEEVVNAVSWTVPELATVIDRASSPKA